MADEDLNPGETRNDEETGQPVEVRDPDSGDAVTVIDSLSDLPERIAGELEHLTPEDQDALLRDWKRDGVHLDAYGDLRTRSGAEVLIPASADAPLARGNEPEDDDGDPQPV